MSSPSAFWAQKRNVVKSSDSPTPPIAEPPKPKPAETSSTKKGLVLKGTANGATKTSTPTSSNGKKTDWADSEDEDEFLTGFSKPPRVITLENEVARKDARIGELEAVVGIKDVRIGELEGQVEEQSHVISSLQTHVEDYSALVSDLKHGQSEQSLYVQELVAEVDEKGRRIGQLEVELDEKGAIIRDLEMKAVAQTRVSTEKVEAHTAVQPQRAITEPAEVKNGESKVAPTTKADNADTAGAIEAQPETHATTATDFPTIEKAKETPSTNSAPEPVFGMSDFPVFATPATIKVAPPHKVPKKLTFPIDFSKYGKKSSTVAKQAEPKKGRGTPATFGLASKQQRTKTDAVPNFNPSLDIRQMPHNERVVYANGPDVTVNMGNVKLANLPKYVLMQCSGKAYKYFSEKPDATSITFPANSMDADAAKAHLTWMDEMTYQGRVYSVTLNTDPKFDQKNLKICRAARVMGLNNSYVGHFTKQLCDRIRNGEASAEFTALVCDLAYPENDPIFECLANNLVNQLIRKTKKPEDLTALLSKHDNLKQKMEEIEQRRSKKRTGP